MPQNCSADVEAVIAHIDQVFTSGTKTQISQLKAMFGWQNMTHLDDAAGACKFLFFLFRHLRLKCTYLSAQQPVGLAESVSGFRSRTALLRVLRCAGSQERRECTR